MAALANPRDLYRLALAAEDAAGALDSRARRIGQAEQRTTWKGPGRRRYDPLSAEARRRAERLGKDLRHAMRLLTKAAKRVEDEIAALRTDERKVRTYRSVSTAGAVPDPAREAVFERVRRNPPPSGDPEWAAMARTLYGRSAATVP
jgi:hypothetical protein